MTKRTKGVSKKTLPKGRKKVITKATAKAREELKAKREAHAEVIGAVVERNQSDPMEHRSVTPSSMPRDTYLQSSLGESLRGLPNRMNIKGNN